MKQLLVGLLLSFNTFGQTSTSFQQAYAVNPFIPNGLLEAVSYTNTHMREITSMETPSCLGMPLPYGIMGVFDNGAGYFHENGQLVAQLSGITIAEQKTSVQNQVLAYANAFNSLMQEETTHITGKNDPQKIYNVLQQLTEIPDSGIVNLYARDAQIFAYLSFMNSNEKAQQFNFLVHHFDLPALFGAENYKVLNAKKVSFLPTGIVSDKNEVYTININKSTQYGPAIWNPAPSCNFSSRNGVAVSAITIHTIQGSYAGAISWSQNCSSSVSYHYVVRSADGQITQMVLEENKAWHVGSENPYTIGYEHEGFVTDPSWYTEEMYQASADLSRDIVNSGYGIPALRTYFGAASAATQTLGSCTKIKGHQHYPNQTHTDPGINWNWEKYYRLINNNPTITTVNSTTGNFYDSGGNTGNYSDDERLITLIQPTNATSITLNFTSFSVESNYDYLFIYDGNSINAPLIGTYTGTNTPGVITSSGAALTLEFRSDCGTVGTGWQANWTSIVPNTTPPTTIVENLNTWKTADWTANFTDAAVGAVSEKYYLAGSKPSGYIGWKANTSLGFLNEDFQDNAADWVTQTDVWSLTNNLYVNSDVNLSNTNVYISVQQDDQSSYLYHWKQNITSSGTNQRAGLHFFCSDATLTNRGNSYFVYFRNSNNKAEIYEVVNDVFTMQTAVNCTVNTNEIYDYKVTYDPQSGWIRVFVNGVLTTEWQDPTPLTSGNSVSLRTGNCIVEYDNVRVYKSRSVNTTIGVGPTAAFFTQSENASDAGLVRSYVLDDTDLWSAEDYELYKVDWTLPVIDLIADGVSADIDTTYSTTLEGNWIAADPHSEILDFEIAIGTSALGTDIQNWTSNGLSATISHVLSNPIYDQLYYISLRATNGASLISELSSDGVRYIEQPSSAEITELLNNISIYPNPATTQLTLANVPFEIQLKLYSSEGKLVYAGNSNSSIDLTDIANGVYQLVLLANDRFVVKKIEVLK
jgi:N-acetyl-anhydromuramyl-L-alanine amidase AmpD